MMKSTWGATGKLHSVKHRLSRIRAGVCRQDGCTDTPGALLGFAAFKYAPGVGLVPNLLDAFRPVSTAFAIAASSADGGGGLCYAHSVTDCSGACPAFDAIEAEENYVGVSTVATAAQARSRDRLNLATTDPAP